MFGLFLSNMVRRIIGIALLFLIGFIISNDRKKIDWMHIAIKFFIICAFAYFFLKVSFMRDMIAIAAQGFISLYDIANIGIEFLFGSLANYCGPCGFVFAVKILPVIIFFSSLVSVLYYYNIIQIVVEGFGKVLQPVFGTNGAETLNAIANSFLGQTEAPLLIRNYLKNMNESEIFAIMVSGMGTISCGLFAIYGAYGISIEYMLIASILSIPSTLLIAKLWYPNPSAKRDKAVISHKTKHANVLDALSSGAIDGINLALNVGAMLMVFISFIFMIDSIMAWLGNFVLPSDFTLTLNSIFGYVMLPFSWILGISEADIIPAAGLIGIKTVVNEMVAYTKMLDMSLDSSTIAMLTFALCGFSNFSSIGIQVGAIGTMEPTIRGTISKLGVKAVFAGLCANVLVACIVGLFL